jgi:hypothetical protein
VRIVPICCRYHLFLGEAEFIKYWKKINWKILKIKHFLIFSK